MAKYQIKTLDGLECGEFEADSSREAIEKMFDTDPAYNLNDFTINKVLNLDEVSKYLTANCVFVVYKYLKIGAYHFRGEPYVLIRKRSVH